MKDLPFKLFAATVAVFIAALLLGAFASERGEVPVVVMPPVTITPRPEPAPEPLVSCVRYSPFDCMESRA